MRASLESRVPFLDFRIAEYVFQLPPSYMINGELNKKILIDSHMEKLDSRITGNIHKKGYASPIEDWFKNEKVKGFIDSIITDESSFIYEFVRFTPVAKLSARQIWMLVSLEIWHKTFITKEYSNAY